MGMVLDLLGPSLRSLFDECCKCFTLKTILMLADQLLHCIEEFHQAGFLHRDIKPDNFCMGLSPSEEFPEGQNANVVHMVDLGMAKKWKNATWRTGKRMVGTAFYASLNSHWGFE